MFGSRLLGSAGALAFLPAAKFESWLADGAGALPSYFRDRGALLADVAKLRMELADHAAAQLTAERLREENEALRELLSASTSPRIAASVVGRPTALPYDVFLIDRGSASGVKENAPVYVSDDRVVGFVARAYEHSSVVGLVSSPGLKSTVYIYGPNIYTTAEGQGGGSLRVAVPQGIELAEGNLVVIPSLGGGVYGEISVVDSVPSRPEQYGYVSIEDPLASIRYVSVGTEPLARLSFEEAKAAVDAARSEILSVDVPQGVLVDVMSTTTAATTTGATSSSAATGTSL